MSIRSIAPALCGLMWCAATLPSLAQQSPEPEATPSAGAEAPNTGSSARLLLDSIRQDLVELRFEKALAAVDGLLGDPSMSEAERVEALVLRAQAHAAFGDFEATEEDYRLILRSRPAYVPEASLIPEKAMQRFRKVRSEMVGIARVTLDPPGARLLVDGREVVLPPDGALPMLGGERLIRAEARGYDPEEVFLAVEPGSELPVRIQLLPNSRDVVIRTELDGVAVYLDGLLVGETARIESERALGLDPPPAKLVLEDVALGEHVFQLQKPCYAPRRLQDMLTVDLLDRSPREYETVRLDPARAMLSVQGGPDGAEILVDGKPSGRLPLEQPLELCPGTVELIARAGGRVVWRSAESLEQNAQRVVEVRPRPSATLVGISEWPAGLERFGAGFSLVAAADLPPTVDLTAVEGWSGVDLPPDTDLAFAVLPPEREGGAERWVLYSTRLRIVEPLGGPPEDAGRPRWHRVVSGMSVADSAVGGPAVVVDVAEHGAAARDGITAGDRVVSVSGSPVGGAEALRRAISAAPPEGPIALRLAGRSGEEREVKLAPSLSPVLWRATDRAHPRTVLAAWAAVDAVSSRERAASALANLALLQSESGKPGLAVDTWQRVRWPERPGVGNGTASYYLARELLAVGREADAIEAFRRAASSAATAYTDEGPAVAPAARDYLTDLGVVLDE